MNYRSHWDIAFYKKSLRKDLEKKWAKCVQLVRVASFRGDFLQHSYFSCSLCFSKTKAKINPHYIFYACLSRICLPRNGLNCLPAPQPRYTIPYHTHYYIGRLHCHLQKHHNCSNWVSISVSGGIFICIINKPCDMLSCKK